MTAEPTEDAATLALRLEQLEKQLHRKKRGRKVLFLSVVGLLLLITIGFGCRYIYQQNTSFSHRIKGLGAGYTLYAPSSLSVGGFTVDPSSLKNNSGYVTFALRNGQQFITVTEQAAPSSPPPLTGFTGFQKLSLPIGNGVVGQIEGRTISVINTDKTILNVTSSAGISPSVITELDHSFQPVK